MCRVQGLWCCQLWLFKQWVLYVFEITLRIQNESNLPSLIKELHWMQDVLSSGLLILNTRAFNLQPLHFMWTCCTMALLVSFYILWTFHFLYRCRKLMITFLARTWIRKSQRKKPPHYLFGKRTGKVLHL